MLKNKLRILFSFKLNLGKNVIFFSVICCLDKKLLGFNRCEMFFV